MSRLTSRTAFLDDRTTSVRLEKPIWDALLEVAEAQKTDRQELLRRIDRDRKPGENLSSAIRVYVVKFYQRRIGALTRLGL